MPFMKITTSIKNMKKIISTRDIWYLDEHLETYPIKYNEQTKTKEKMIEYVSNAKLLSGVPNHYCIKYSDTNISKK